MTERKAERLATRQVALLLSLLKKWQFVIFHNKKSERTGASWQIAVAGENGAKKIVFAPYFLVKFS